VACTAALISAASRSPNGACWFLRHSLTSKNGPNRRRRPLRKSHWADDSVKTARPAQGDLVRPDAGDDSRRSSARSPRHASIRAARIPRNPGASRTPAPVAAPVTTISASPASGSTTRCSWPGLASGTETVALAGNRQCRARRPEAAPASASNRRTSPPSLRAGAGLVAASQRGQLRPVEADADGLALLQRKSA